MQITNHGVSGPEKVTAWCVVSFHPAFVACRPKSVLQKYKGIVDRRTFIDSAFDKLAIFSCFSLVDTHCADLLIR